MVENDFEGTLVLEKLAEIDAVDAFYDAIDADDFDRIHALLKRARLDAQTITQTLREIRRAAE
jgi:hypothetical protein